MERRVRPGNNDHAGEHVKLDLDYLVVGSDNDEHDEHVYIDSAIYEHIIPDVDNHLGAVQHALDHYIRAGLDYGAAHQHFIAVDNDDDASHDDWTAAADKLASAKLDLGPAAKNFYAAHTAAHALTDTSPA